MRHCVLHPDRKAVTTAAHIPVCEECDIDYAIEGRQYLRFEERTFFQSLLNASKLSDPTRRLITRSAEEAAWRIQYAPFGYIFATRAIDFIELELKNDTRWLIAWTIQYLHDSLRQRLYKVGSINSLYYDEGRSFTRISVYPKQVGESLNTLDPLRLRMGIDIEVRWPVDSEAELRACALSELS